MHNLKFPGKLHCNVLLFKKSYYIEKMIISIKEAKKLSKMRTPSIRKLK